MIRDTKRRLASMETRTGQATIKEHAEVLATILAHIDALFWPLRDPTKLAAVHQKRDTYHRSGIAWTGSSQGGSSRAWKTDQRQREALAGAGLIKLTKTKSTLPGVKLTLKAEHAIRQLVGIQPLERVSAALILHRLNADTPKHRVGGWLCEVDLFGFKYSTSSEWDRSTLLILPMLVAGLVESKSSTAKQMFYRPSTKEIPNVGEGEHQTDYDLADIYIDTFFDGLKTNKQLLPTDHNEIVIPLPATI